MKKECQELFDSVIESLKAYPWSSEEAYADYLAQTYYYVRHSTRLLAVAAGLMNQEDQPLHQRFLQHTVEENAHELMLIKDLKAIGKSIEDYPEKPETRAFWEPQYYKIEHQDPAILLGYIVMLEEVAAKICPWINSQLEEHFGKKAATFIRVHGEEDEGHVEEAYNFIATLDKKRQLNVYENAIQSSKTYLAMMKSLTVRHASKTISETSSRAS